jgi:hypothetical protein
MALLLAYNETGGLPNETSMPAEHSPFPTLVVLTPALEQYNGAF